MCLSSIIQRQPVPPICVTPESPAAEAARLITARDLGAVPVRDAQGRLVGVLSERDIVRIVAHRAAGLRGLAVAEVMTPEPAAVRPDMPVAAVVELMESRRLRHVPVCAEDGRLLGLVGLPDLLREEFAPA